jgi:general secretion pathway protein N
MMRAARPIAIAAALMLGAIETHGANSPNALDLPPSNVLPTPLDMAPAAPAEKAERPAEQSGNPLWAIPLSSLTATRDRPLFTPSRRPPAAAIAGPVAPAPVAAPPPPAAEPDRPQLTLVGAIAGRNDGIAVFLDQTNNNVVRLRTGQDHLGWVLRSVKGREAVLEKDRLTATLALSPTGIAPMPGGFPPAPGAPAPAPGGKPKEPEL